MSNKESPLWEQLENIGMCSLQLGDAKVWCLIHIHGAYCMDLHGCLFPEHFSSRAAPGDQYWLQNRNI